MKKLWLNFSVYVEKNHFSILGAFLLGSCSAFFIYINFLQFPLLSKQNFVIALTISGLITVVLEFIFIKIIKPFLSSLGRKKTKWLLIITLSFSLLLLFFLEITSPHYYFIYPRRDLHFQITPIDANQTSGEIILTYAKNELQDISFSEFEIEGQYEIHEEGIHLYPGKKMDIHWKGVTGDEFSVIFKPLTTDQSIQVNWGDDQIDLYELDNHQDIETKISHNFPVPFNESLINRLIAFPLIFGGFFLLFSGFFSSSPYASFIILVWTLILLILWPGIIGNVNINNTNDLFSGILSDWHPVFYTLVLGGIIKLTSTASTFLFFQILSLGLVIGYGFTYLDKIGCNKRLLWILTIIITLLPNNILSIITLTNDIPYSIALLLLTIFVIKIVLSDGQWLNKTKNWVSLILLSLLAILFRYNGIPAIAFTFLFLIIFYPKQRKFTIASILILTMMIIFINGPVYNLINVKHEAKGQLDNIILHHISAHIDQGTPLSIEENNYLDSLYPLHEWEYKCCTNGAMFFKSGFNQAAFHRDSELNLRIFLDLFAKNPKVEINHVLCASDMIWNITGKCEIENPTIGYNDSGYYWTQSYFSEYQTNSKLPMLVKPIADLFISSENNQLLFILFWRPAVYLYFAILTVLIFFIKIRNSKVFIILTPLLGQSIFLFFFNRVQNFRYQYCAVLIGLFLISLISIPESGFLNKEIDC